MLKQISRLLALGVFALITSGFVGEAHAAQFTVRIDNLLNPSGYPDAKTANTVVVRIYYKNGGLSSQSRVLNSTSETHDFVFLVAGQDTTTINYIEVSVDDGANQNDLFIMDQMELRTQAGVLAASWGIDNEFGYCLSWDPADGGNWHCHNGQAVWGLPFYP